MIFLLALVGLAMLLVMRVSGPRHSTARPPKVDSSPRFLNTGRLVHAQHGGPAVEPAHTGRTIVAWAGIAAAILMIFIYTTDGGGSLVDSDDPTANCDAYATDVAGGKAFAGGESYNEAHAACESVNR